MKLRYLMIAGLLAPLWVAADDTNLMGKFKLLDKDNNGMITKMEAASDKQITQDWSKIDINNDGNITQSEMAMYHPAKDYSPVEGENEPMGAAPTQ